MSSNKLDKAVAWAEFAARREAVIEEVIRDLEALARDFAGNGPTLVDPVPVAARVAYAGDEKSPGG